MLQSIFVVNLNFTHSVHGYQTRGNSSNSLVIPRSKSNSGLRTFQVRAAHLWNDTVGVDIRSCFDTLSLYQFKDNVLAVNN